MIHIIYSIVENTILFFSNLLYRLLKIERIYKSNLYYNIDEIPLSVTHCVILGAKLRDDNIIPPILKERLDAAVNLFHQRPNTTFILSGDGTKRISNDVQTMYNYLKSHCDLPDSQIILDNYGLTTYDSIRNIPENISKTGFILLTSAFHMPRSVYFCHRMGKKVYAYHLESGNSSLQKGDRRRELLAIDKYIIQSMLGFPGFHDFWHVMWFKCSLVIGKILFLILCLCRQSTTFFPGKFVLRVCPYAFLYLTEHISLILVTGSEGMDYLCNALNQNMEKKGVSYLSICPNTDFYSNIATKLLCACSFTGKYKEQYAIIGSDTDFFAMSAGKFTSSDITVIVTNIINYQEEQTMEAVTDYKYILSGIENLSDSHVYLNSACNLTPLLAKEITNHVCYFEYSTNTTNSDTLFLSNHDFC